MSARATQLDVSALSINSVSLLGIATTATLTITHQTSDGQAISRKYASPQPVKSSWSLSYSQKNVKSNPALVTNLDLTDITVGGTDFTASLESMTLNANFTHVPGDACEDGWAFPVFTMGVLAGSMTFKVSTSAVPLMASQDAPGDADMAFTFTLNGGTVTFPIVVTSLAHGASNGQVQTVTVSFEGQDPRTGTYPTAPTGTTTILEKILNTPQTSLAAAFTTKASGGVAYSGNVLIQSYSLNVSNAATITEEMTWAGEGVLTSAATV